MKRTSLLVLIITSTLYGAFAQNTYTLQQCIDYALKNHRSIKIAQNDVESAIAHKNEGRSGYLPQVNGQAQWDDNLILQTTVIPAGTFGPGTPEQRIQFGNQYNTIMAVQLDQTLYNHSFIEGIRALKPNEDLAKLKKTKTEEDVIYNTIAAYYNILLITENEKLLQQSEERLRKTLPIVKLQWEKGVIKKMDVDRVQVNYNNIVANQEILKTRKEVAYNNLKYNMALPLETVIAIDTNYSKEIVSLENYTDTANIKNKIELKILRQSLALNQINYKRQRANYYPTLSFYAKYGGNAFGNKAGQSFTNWTQFSAIGFKLNVPIFDGLRNSSSLKQMQLGIESLKENIAQTEEGLKLQMLNSTTELSNSVTNLSVNKETLELAKSIYNTTTLQYQKGVIAYSDLLSAEFAYKEAEANYLQSLVKYLNAKLEADKSNNNLNTYIK